MADEPQDPPEPPEVLRRQGITGARDNVEEGQVVSVPGRTIFQFFGRELMEQFSHSSTTRKGEEEESG